MLKDKAEGTEEHEAMLAAIKAYLNQLSQLGIKPGASASTSSSSSSASAPSSSSSSASSSGLQATGVPEGAKSAPIVEAGAGISRAVYKMTWEELIRSDAFSSETYEMDDKRKAIIALIGFGLEDLRPAQEQVALAMCMDRGSDSVAAGNFLRYRVGEYNWLHGPWQSSSFLEQVQSASQEFQGNPSDIEDVD